MKKFAACFAALVFTCQTLPAHAQDLEAAEETYQKVCRACHGPKAQGLASYPKLNDKTVEYISDRLMTYRNGDKIGPNSMLMIPHAKKLSDEDIAGIAEYVTTAFK